METKTETKNGLHTMRIIKKREGKKPIKKKSGVTEQKKSEIDSYSNQVLENQSEVDQQQAIVTSLTGKLNKLQGQLTEAENNKAVALSNFDLGKEVLSNASDLMNTSGKTYLQILDSEKEIKDLSKSINKVINQLIYSVEVINKLSVLITKKKEANPLISDELVNVIATAGTNANNAVSLTMTALKSVFVSQATIMESESSLALEYSQSMKLVEFITGKEVDKEKSDLPISPIMKLLKESYETSLAIYNSALEAYQDTQNQLESAKNALSKAQSRLTSSQAALAAANAAALAS